MYLEFLIQAIIHTQIELETENDRKFWDMISSHMLVEDLIADTQQEPR